MAASMRNPVVVILGATGTGKTKLSLELAKRFNGELISADSIQLYKGLDIITNKATEEERAACKHHMIDFLSPLKEDNTVVNYRDQAVPIIDSLLEQQKTPVVVGGTNYYIEALLWKHLVNDEDVKRAASQIQARPAKFPKLQEPKKISGEIEQTDVTLETKTDDLNHDKNTKLAASSSSSPPLSSSLGDDELDLHDKVEDGANNAKDINDDKDVNDTKDNNDAKDTNDAKDDNDEKDALSKASHKYAFMDVSSAELYKRLQEIDPDTALKLHPNDRRKITRAIMVYMQHGVRMSEVQKAQRQKLSGPSISGPLRYKDCCVFWLQCNQDVLDKRLDDRVDKMLEMGLLDELTQFHKQYNEERLRQGKENDYTSGIFQSIGFKEFHTYLTLSEAERQTDEGQKALEKGISDMKLSTRRYARYQNRWVKNRLIKRPCREECLPVYGLDCTDVSLWDDNVSKPATTILTALTKGEESPIPAIPFEEEHIQKYEYNECKYCNVTAVLQQTWKCHIGSRKHKNNVQRYKRQMVQLTQNLDAYVKQEKQKDDTSK